MVQLLIFGNSITYGSWDKEGGWVQRLRNFVDEKNTSNPTYYCLIYNLGVPGDTVEEILERFESETKSRLDENEELILIFQVGLNDSVYLNDEDEQRFLVEVFQDNIKTLIKISKRFAKKIIFLGLTPVEDKKVDPIPWDKNKSYKNELIKDFNAKLKETCNKREVGFIDIYEKFIENNYESLLDDGVHPNTEGHKRIFEIVKEYLVKNKKI